jgi:hypothetical protein
MTQDIEVVKSPADKKLYKLIKLENGLTALLIHDPTIKDTEAPDAQEVWTRSNMLPFMLDSCLEQLDTCV